MRRGVESPGPPVYESVRGDGEGLGQPRFARGASHYDLHFSGLNPPPHVGVQEGQLADIEMEFDLSSLPRLKVEPAEAGELQNGPRNHGEPVADVQLYDLGPGPVAVVCHCEGNVDRIAAFHLMF